MATSAGVNRKRGRPRVGITLPRRIGALFVLPSLLLFAVFVAYPIFTALCYSFFDWTGIHRGVFFGLGNYSDLFTRLSYKNALPYVFGTNRLLFLVFMVFQNTVA